jgi:hypothetical protein
MPSPFSRGGTQNIITPLQHPGDYDETDDFSQFVPRAPRAALRRQSALDHVFDTQPIEFPEMDANFEDQGMTQVEQDDDAIETYKTSDTAISCYASPSALNTMSQMTQTL